MLESFAYLLHFLEVSLSLLQVLSQDFLLLASVSFAHLQFQLQPLAILSQFSLLQLLACQLLIITLLHLCELLLELLLQVVYLFGCFFFANDGFTLGALNCFQHPVVVASVLGSLVSLLLQLQLQEL